MNSRLAAFVCCCLVAALYAPAGAADKTNTLFEDATITGKQIHTFTDSGRNVVLVLGRFKLTVGRRVFTGRDAVVWVRQEKAGNATQNSIVVYIEGGATATEANGTVTKDRTMLVRLRQQGRLVADGATWNKALLNFPLYGRAKAARRGEATRSSAPRPMHAAPVLVAAAPKAAPAKRAKKPKAAPAKKKSAAVPNRPKSHTVQPVTWRADSIMSEQRGARRVTVLRGNVYLSQGDPRSDKFLELRSQAAVLFSEKLVVPKKSTSPISPRVKGVKTDLPAGKGAKEARETITGAYLEGDVIVSRGDRSMRGPSAYYDFITDRAILVDPVFRTVQKQRNIPVYIRAAEARVLSAREIWFRDAKITTSDFYSPGYHIGAKTAYIMDNTPYDDKGVRIGERSWCARLKHSTFNIRGLPVLYTPYTASDLTEGNTALRKIQVGRHGRFGFGVETEWHLFRLLGLLRPEGFRGRFSFDYYDRGVLSGVDLKWARPKYSGYAKIFGLVDRRQEDSFGDDREDISAPRYRGRALIRHKQLLPENWQLQLEMSYMCDRNFLEQFFSEEFYAAKEQETLLYLKKQRDDWAFDVLAQMRINRFLSQAESAPELGFTLIGRRLANIATFYHESRAGFKRYRIDNALAQEDSEFMVRLDTRNELQFPLEIGPVNVVPYAVGRVTWWSDEPDRGQHGRLYGQTGVKANMHFWRVYSKVRSRLWDLNRLRHIISPEITAFIAGDGDVNPDNLFPMDPDVEQHLDGQGGVAFGVRQRLQTKRGRPGHEHNVDWMRFDVMCGFYGNGADPVPGDGRFFLYRPEYSLGRNHVNFDYTWNISDSTAFLADLNYDVDSSRVRRANVGFAVARDPRLRYYAGLRYIKDVDSSVGTFAVNYRINRKYTLSFVEQYDFQFEGGQNLTTAITITRKLPRWYAAFSFVFNQADDEVTMVVSFWPEGVPEVKIGGARVSLLGGSSEN